MKNQPLAVGCTVRPSLARRLFYCLALAGVLTATFVAMIDRIGIDKYAQNLPISGLTSVFIVIGVVFVVTVTLALIIMAKSPRIIAFLNKFYPLPFLSLSFCKRSVIAATVAILVCWLPWIILEYPCSMNTDTYNQLYQFQTESPTFYNTLNIYVDAEYIDHHPVFDTLLFGTFLWLGDALGSQNIGLFIYSLAQCVLTAAALSLSCCYLDRLRVPKVFRLVALLFIALFPPIPLWATCMIKDSIFAVVYVLFFLMYIEAFLSRGKILRQTKFLIGFIAVTGACIITKKTGIYIAIPSLIALFIVCRPEWKRVAIATFFPVLVFSFLLPALVYPAIGGVSSGGNQEFLGAFYQQVVTVLRNEDNDITAEERQAIDKVLRTDEAIKAYKKNSVDPVKSLSKPEATTRDLIDFFGAYFSIGVRHPIDYTRSIGCVAAPLLSPGAGLTFHISPTQEESWVNLFSKARNAKNLHLAFDKPDNLEAIATDFKKAYDDQFDSTNPFSSIIFTRGLYGGWIPFICIFLSACNNRKNWIVFVPTILSVLVLIISPAASPRYVLALLYTTPLMLGLLCHSFLQTNDYSLRPEHATEKR